MAKCSHFLRALALSLGISVSLEAQSFDTATPSPSPSGTYELSSPAPSPMASEPPLPSAPPSPPPTSAYPTFYPTEQPTSYPTETPRTPTANVETPTAAPTFVATFEPTPLATPTLSGTPSVYPTIPNPPVSGSSTLLEERLDLSLFPADVDRDAEEALDEVAFQQKHGERVFEVCGTADARAALPISPPDGLVTGVRIYDESIAGSQIGDDIYEYRLDLHGLTRVEVAPPLAFEPFRFGSDYTACYGGDFVILRASRGGRFVLRIEHPAGQGVIVVDMGLSALGRVDDCRRLDLNHPENVNTGRQVQIPIPWSQWPDVQYYIEHSAQDVGVTPFGGFNDFVAFGIPRAGIPATRLQRHHSVQELAGNLRTSLDVVIGGHGLASQISAGLRSEGSLGRLLDGWNRETRTIARRLHYAGTRNVFFWGCCVGQQLKNDEDQWNTEHLMYAFATSLAAPGQRSRAWGYDEPVYADGLGRTFIGSTSRLRGIEYSIEEETTERLYCSYTGNMDCNLAHYSEVRDARDLGSQCKFNYTYTNYWLQSVTIPCDGSWTNDPAWF